MSEGQHKQALPLGYELNGYRVVSVLGVGGFGVTYLAEHVRLGHRVALKEYLPNEFAVREGTTVHAKSDADRDSFEWGLGRFLDEAKTLARFEHRNLVRVRDYFEANSTAYIVMDYEEGESLDRLLSGHGTLSEAQLRRVLLPIVDGLRAVHGAGFLHRDIKPSNVYVRRSDESPVLLDFGAARQALGRKSRSLTAVASAGYSPPEQYESEGEQGPWTDIYALAALCHRAITGEVPMEAPRRLIRLAHGKPDPMPRLSEVNPEGYSEELLEAMDWGLRVIETQRPSSLDDWVVALEGATVPQPDSTPTGLGRPQPRIERTSGGSRSWVWATAATLGLAAVGVVTWWLVMNPVADSSPSDTSGVLGGGSAIVVVATEPPGAQVFIGGEAAGQTLLQLRDVRAGMHDVVLDHPDFERVELGGETFVDDVVLRIERTLVPATGRLTVITEPETAWVERDGTRLAQGTPVTLEGLSAGPVELTLGAEAYRSVSVVAEVPRDGVGRLEWTLEPIRYGTLTVDVEPEDAIVTLPDIGPAYEPGMALLEGEYRVAVRREGYRAVTRTVSVSGETRERMALERALVPGDTFADTMASGGESPEMVVIPAGRFRMGCMSGQDCFDVEQPVHEVTIPEAFEVSKYEVTFAQWDACVAGGGCGGYRPDDEGWGRGTRPVINVSWDDAQAYVSWLSRQTGEVYRLLSESEWEYVARAGTSTAYSWGNAIGSNRANCDGCGSQWDDRQTAPVGSFQANAFGVHDMHGNVWEWVEDCRNASYAGAPSDGSAWRSEDCSERVLRGGSWYSYPRSLRSANRNGNTTGVRISYLGFRVARTLTP